MSAVEGKAWVFGDNINSDVLAPGIYFKESMQVMASHCLEAIDPDFAPNVKPGDIVVAGRSFGVGSAREQAAMAFRELKVGALLAESYARIFYRNALNLGVPALMIPDDHDIEAAHEVSVDAIAGLVINKTTGRRYEVAPIPSHLMDMIQVGGLMPYLKARIESGDLKPAPAPE